MGIVAPKLSEKSEAGSSFGSKSDKGQYETSENGETLIKQKTI
jgi:hypothetical protein